MQLVELQAALPALQAVGIQPLALSYDDQTTLAAFAAARGITYPLLADEGSLVIRRLGLFHPAFPPDHPRHGVAQPGTYLLDRDGRVTRAIVHASQTVRDAWPTALHEIVRLAANDAPLARQVVDDVAVTVALDSPVYRPRQRVGLRAVIEIAPGAYLYGQPLPDVDTPLTLAITAPPGVSIEPPVYPPAALLPLPALGETLPGYTGRVELTAYLTFDELREDVTIEATVRFQVCTATARRRPAAVTLALPIHYRPPD